MRITFLGTGTSHGVPTIDCMLDNYESCPRKVCLKAATNPRYRRTRASILVETEEAAILFDTSQDFRQQVLSNRVRRIDAVLYTHGHADHIYGLPDIRSYCRQQEGPIDIYGSAETLRILRGAFQYIFDPPDYVGGGIPKVIPHVLDAPIEIGKAAIIPLPVEHGPLEGCQGYRMDDVAYIPDAKRIPEDTLDKLEGLDLLILNCLRLRPHGSHLCLKESLAYARQLAPTRCLFTHMTHDIDYQVEGKKLPGWADFAYDGLVVEV
ncbi:MAG: MBL fold metallo-hydrolase [Chloroflexota bacterium]|nr:MBL fold metallo-hydrolase [Chloroflexota bacterium]